MTLHHTKHHQALVDGYNIAKSAYDKATTLEEQLAILPALQFNSGGDINHSLYWKSLAPPCEKGGNGGLLKDGNLKTAIVETFGGLESLQHQFNNATLDIRGSGWGWLGVNPKTNRLEITTTANQDPLLDHVPVFGIDGWEHSWYPQYKNAKVDYLKAIWNVINFKEAERRFNETIQAGA